MNEHVDFLHFDDHSPSYAVPLLSADYWLLGITRGMNARFAALGRPGRLEWRYAHGRFYMAVSGSMPFAPEPHQPNLRERWDAELWPELQRAYAEIDAAPPDTEAWNVQWEKLDRLWEIHFEVVTAAYQATVRFVAEYGSLVGGSREDALALLQGSSATTQALERDLRELVETARANPSGLQEAALSFLERHGHVARDTLLASPTWEEDPGALLAEVARRVEHRDPPAGVRADADARAQQVRASLADTPGKLAQFDDALAVALRDGSLQEEHATYIDQMLSHRMRRLALRAGARLSAAGAIDDATDVVHLTKDEIAELLTACRDMREAVRERKATLDAQNAMRPPKVLGGEAPEPASVPQDGVLRGVAASPGVGRGPARVVRSFDDFDRVRPGDVLVCQSTSPSYTPTMAIAAAVVTGTGGELSHAAVESRELGVPAVVGVTGALDLIADGQVVEVDGTAGTVHLH